MIKCHVPSWFASCSMYNSPILYSYYTTILYAGFMNKWTFEQRLGTEPVCMLRTFSTIIMLNLVHINNTYQIYRPRWVLWCRGTLRDTSPLYLELYILSSYNKMCGHSWEFLVCAATRQKLSHINCNMLRLSVRKGEH